MSVDRQPEDEVPPSDRPVDLAALYQRHHVRLHGHAASKLPPHLQHEADAALMTVFRRLLAARAEGRCKDQPNWEAYLLSAVTNACLDIIKTTQDNEELDDADPRIHRDAASDPTADTVIDHLEHAAQVAAATAALDTLDERSRAIIIGRYGHGLTNRAIGTNLGLTGQRVGQLHDEALRELRQEVNRHDQQSR